MDGSIAGGNMMRVVKLGRTGVFVVMRNGAVTSLGGCSYWVSLEDVMKAIRAENVPVCDQVLRTH